MTQWRPFSCPSSLRAACPASSLSPGWTRTQITQIRPLLYCGENLVRHTARRLSLPVVENPCPANGNTKRQEIKELIYELQGRYPGLKSRVFGSMQRLPLPEWGPVEHRRRPLPEEIGE